MNLTIARGRLLLLALCLPLPMPGAADTTDASIPEGVDISAWECEYCVFEQGFSGELEAGAGFVSDDSYKFGEYNGLNDNGAFLIGNATARYRDENAGYLDLRLRDLGLDTRSLDIEGGRQGRYRLFLNYDEIPHYLSDSAKTPYLGIGGNSLQLPPGWVSAGSTAGMTELATSLQNVELKTQRKRLAVGMAFIPVRKWETAVTFRHETRDGLRRAAGSFFFNSAQLVEPVDYVTDEVEASVSYVTRKWQSRLSYYGSFFNNHDRSLSWQNAYNPIVLGADAGQLALPPDNRFHQILLASGYQLREHTRLSGDIAFGRMEQDEDLLAASLNPNLAVALPRTAANARVDTLTANLKVDSAVNDRLRLNAAYRYNDRDNKTPSEVFDWVTTDAFVAASRRNLPYSFRDHSLNLKADYRFEKRTRLSAGYDYQKKNRTNQEVNHTTENTLWARVSMRARDNIDVAIKAAHAERNASDYQPVAETDPAQNPLLRKYNMADRSRDTGSLNIGFNLKEWINIGLGIELSRDDYSDSLLGLTGSRETAYNADASAILTEATSLHVFANLERIKSRQAGSQAFAGPDWFAKNNDSINTLGIGVKHRLIEDKLDVGADYVLSRSTGEVSVETGAPGADFPDLKADLDTLKLYADYRLKENMTLHAAYWYEHYDSKDWMLDAVAADTVPNLIALGQDSSRYDVHALMLSVRYRF